MMILIDIVQSKMYGMKLEWLLVCLHYNIMFYYLVRESTQHSIIMYKCYQDNEIIESHSYSGIQLGDVWDLETPSQPYQEV